MVAWSCNLGQQAYLQCFLCDLVVSIAGLVRNEFDTKVKSSMTQRTVLLFSIANQLKKLVDAYKLCVVVVNQVTICPI
jgi:RecA/RadA recombinase